MVLKKKGQSTLEYITVFVAIIAAIVLVAFKVLQPSVNKIIESSANKIDQAATKFNTSNVLE
jgi:uncharacterized protein (UPF0333 family)